MSYYEHSIDEHANAVLAAFANEGVISSAASCEQWDDEDFIRAQASFVIYLCGQHWLIQISQWDEKEKISDMNALDPELSNRWIPMAARSTPEETVNWLVLPIIDEINEYMEDRIIEYAEAGLEMDVENCIVSPDREIDWPFPSRHHRKQMGYDVDTPSWN